ncbi:MAG: EFR1 family ferrodoxin [Candidatus Bipolaricaulota bacterium]
MLKVSCFTVIAEKPQVIPGDELPDYYPASAVARFLRQSSGEEISEEHLMKVLILYFSGTGNTKFIAEKIYRKLEEREYTAEVSSVETFPQKDVDDYDFLVFGYPVHGYEMPSFLKSYLGDLSLPRSNGVIVYSTMGYSGGNSLRRTSDILGTEGFKVVGSEEFRMPGNDGLIISGKDSDTVREVLDTDYNRSPVINEKVSSIAQRIGELAGDEVDESEVLKPEKKFTYVLLTPLMKLVFYLFEKIFVGKFRADESCVECGLCEEICPSDNIELNNGKVVFGDDCYFCLRCINQCPVEAIQISKFTEGKFRFKGPMGNYRPDLLEKNP